MSAFLSPAVGVASAVVAVASLLLYLHSNRRSDKDSAREEALALAETRGEMLEELRAALKLHELRQRRMRADSVRRISDLQAALEEARAEACRAQRFYADALADVLASLRDDLEETPPDVEEALVRIRELLPTTERTITPGS